MTTTVREEFQALLRQIADMPPVPKCSAPQSPTPKPPTYHLSEVHEQILDDLMERGQSATSEIAERIGRPTMGLNRPLGT